MYDLEDRILLENGDSIVDDDYAISLLIKEGHLPKHIKVIESEDSEKYYKKYREDISYKELDIDIKPNMSYDEQRFDEIVEMIFHKRRDNTTDIDHKNRFIKEMDFFIDNGLQSLIIKMYDMVNQFKQDDVIWGVGRGSSCACYVFYLMEVHDINPINFDIPFKEFSKE